MFPFYKLRTESIMERKEKEKQFIKKYKPDLNSTWNVLSRDTRSPFHEAVYDRTNS